MQKQYDVAVCLDELHHTMKALILEGRFNAILLRKFSQEEIAAHLPAQCQSFLQGMDEAVRREAQVFCQDFCRDFVANQQRDYEDMLKLQKFIQQYSNQFRENRMNVKQKVRFPCQVCTKNYATPNGLHNHITKGKCPGRQEIEEASTMRRRLRRERRAVKQEQQ